MKNIFILTFIAIFSSPVLFAAIPPKVKRTPQFFEGSAATKGGNFKGMQSILDIRHTADPKKNVERLVIDLGTQDGRVLLGEVGYYHVEYKKEQNALIIDIAQTPVSKVSINQLRAKLQKSMLIKKADMILDPVTNNLNLSLTLTEQAKPRVFRAVGKKTASKIVVDVVKRM